MEVSEKFAHLETRIHRLLERVKQAEIASSKLQADLRGLQTKIADQNEMIEKLRRQLSENDQPNQLSDLQRTQIAERLENMLLKIESLDIDFPQ